MLQPLVGIILIEAETVVETAQRELSKAMPGFEFAPPKFQGPPNVGTVRYLGAGVKNLAVGDRVVFKHDGKRGFEFEGEKLLRVKISDVLAVMASENQ